MTSSKNQAYGETLKNGFLEQMWSLWSLYLIKESFLH